jgi:hypothetical protein
MKKTYLPFILCQLLILSSCVEIQDILETSLGSGQLTSEEVSFGLKEALQIGTKQSIDILSAMDGFFKDELVKILLPKEAERVAKVIRKIPGGNKIIRDIVLQLNRAAEDAVKEAGPIFYKAIKSLTIEDAFNILRGADNAATQFLKDQTYSQLEALFKPKISNSLDKVLVGNISTNQSWDLFTRKYNQVAKSVAGQVAGLKPFDLRLEDYVTQKALDALFFKIGLEEKKIRENPLARTTMLLKRVFGSLDK